MWFLIGFHFISFFKKIKKKCFPLWHPICSFEKKKKLEIEKDMIHEKIQKNKKTKNCSKNVIIFSNNLNRIFWPGKHWNLVFSIFIKVVENWISFQKKSIPNQLEFWAASSGQNTKQVQKITQIQHHFQFSFKISNGDQHQICSGLSNRLIPSLSFRRKFFEK